MKCKNNILIAHYTGAGYSQILGSVDIVSYRKSPTINGYYEERICGGDIKVSLHINPSTRYDFDLSDVEMDFRCETCQKSYPEIAQGYNLESLVEVFNNILKEME